MWARVNLFVAWFLIPQTLVLGWVAAIGRVVLELLGVDTHEGDFPGRIVGALIVFGVVFVMQHLWGSLPPQGKPGGNGYRFGMRLVLIANVLAGLLLIYPYMMHLIENRDVIVVLNKFTDAFGYWVMALWVVGFSFLYQSSLPQQSVLSGK